MLGELYKPRGLARETAQTVLEVEEPHAVNVALGCENGCLYCYGPLATRQSRANWQHVRRPKRPPVELVRAQLDKGVKPDGVFLSFLTDPLLPLNTENTDDLIRMLVREDVKVATSSKRGMSFYSVVQGYKVRHGMSVVSVDSEFWHKFETNTTAPMERITILQAYANYSWFSMEPYPPSAIWKQNILDVLEHIKFADLIVFGKWNYDKRANTREARIEYAENIQVLRDFCKSNQIRLHIKSDTLRFISGKKVHYNPTIPTFSECSKFI